MKVFAQFSGAPAPRGEDQPMPSPAAPAAVARTSAAPAAPAARDARLLARVIHATFFLLLGSALARFVQRHASEPQAPAVLALAAALGVLYVIGAVHGRGDAGIAPEGRFAPVPGRVPLPRLLWLGALVATWAVLVSLAPSFSWCAVPLFYATLRTLPPVPARLLLGLLTVFVILAQLRLAHRFDLDLVVGPPAVALLATAVFTSLDGQSARQAALIRDLVSTRRELAATERREGTLAERQRLAMEIHDTLAQSLSSQHMLLQAADRLWSTDPDRAREHVRTATAIGERSLAEARRFVHDLAPADLADGGSLEAALRTLAARESTERLAVECHIDGAPGAAPLPDRVQSGLLRVAQGALANVREHADAGRAALTLTYLDDQVRLDVADDGRGFDPAAVAGRRPGGEGVRGHGLPAIRARVRQLGGTLTIESAPGDGTVLSAAVPLHAAAVEEVPAS
jgi:signal transduction histidine kinase